MRNNLPIRALLNSLGVLAYTSLIAAFLANGERIFGGQDNHFLIPAVMLMLFVLSAAITGSLVMGKPILLYMENKKSEALKLFFYTIGFMAAITIIVLGCLALTR